MLGARDRQGGHQYGPFGIRLSFFTKETNNSLKIKTKKLKTNIPAPVPKQPYLQ